MDLPLGEAADPEKAYIYDNTLLPRSSSPFYLQFLAFPYTVRLSLIIKADGVGEMFPSLTGSKGISNLPFSPAFGVPNPF